MKTWIKRSLIGLFSATVLVGGLAACAGNHHRHGMATMSDTDMARMKERFVDKAGRELALDEAQKAKLGLLADALKAQRDALKATTGGVSGGTGNLRAEAQSLVAGTQFDRARAQALVDAKTGAVRDKAPAVVTAAGDFYDSLKPEQQQKVRDFMAKGGRRWGGA